MGNKKILTVSSLFLATTLLAGCGGGSSTSKHVHNYGDLVAKANATCEEDGHEAYYHCEGCDTFFNENKEEIAPEDLTIKATGHNWAFVAGKPASCTESGYKDYYDCSRCEEYAETQTGEHKFEDLEAWKKGEGKIDAGQHELSFVAGEDFTCTTPGYRGYYVCSACQGYFSDAEGKNAIEDLEAWKLDPNGGYLPAAHHLVEHEAKNPTGFNDGNTYYSQCEMCEKYFSDHECEHEAEEGSWVIPATGMVTFDSATQIENSTSKEGDAIALDKYGVGSASGAICTLDPAGTHEDQTYNGYLMMPTLHGVTGLTIKGNGNIAVRTGVEAWKWETVCYFSISSEKPITLNLDPNRDNAVIIASTGGQVSLNEIKVTSALKDGTGTSDADLLQNAVVAEGLTTNVAYGYFTDKDTNNSGSALLIGAHCNTEAWPCVFLDFPSGLNLNGGNISFDAKGLSGRKRVSLTLFDADLNIIAGEIGYDLSSSWETFTYNCSAAKKTVRYMRLTVFTTSVSDVHETLIDNLIVKEAGLVTETNAPAWSYRAFDADRKLSEAQYIDKALAIDFKPETANAAFEIDYMSDVNNYVGKKNFVKVVNGAIFSTFGTISANAAAGEGWYTLTVSEKNLESYNRLRNSSNATTIDGIYLATDYAMTGSVTFNYRSLRVVDDIAPTRNPKRYTAAAEGITFWGNDVLDVAFVNDYRGTEGNALMISFKVEGAVGSCFSMNFADSGVGQKIFKTIIITVTEDGLTTNCGVLKKAVDDYYNLYIRTTDVDAAALTSANGSNYINVFWMGGDYWTIDAVSFDTNAFKIYKAGSIVW
ncbi:MAG: hypothetical protein MJ239_02135 [Bacilli bacterium]|nr:hypothetical protein [Bacilli bacterium]